MHRLVDSTNRFREFNVDIDVDVDVIGVDVDVLITGAALLIKKTTAMVMCMVSAVIHHAKLLVGCTRGMRAQSPECCTSFEQCVQ